MNMRYGKCGKVVPGASGKTPTLCVECLDSVGVRSSQAGKTPTLCVECLDSVGVRSSQDEVQWAEGWDPEMHINEDGNFVAGNDKYPFWQLKKGEDANIQPIQRDNIVECLDNTGMEDKFSVGVEYVFEGTPGDMIEVWDKFGTKRECFASRFKVISQEFPEYHMHKMNPGGLKT